MSWLASLARRRLDVIRRQLKHVQHGNLQDLRPAPWAAHDGEGGKVITITVLIVDDSVTIRAILEEVLGRQPGITLVGAAADAQSAIRMVARYQPDVTTVDVAMPGTDGIALLERIRETTNVVMLTSHPEAEDRAFDHGALGFFNKSKIISEVKELVHLIHSAAMGKRTRNGVTEDLPAVPPGQEAPPPPAGGAAA